MSSIAVIDVETTGLRPYRHDRVVELAAVIITTDGEVIREFVSLVNPERDIGPTSVHGLTSADIMPAPSFGLIAGSFIEALGDCVAMAGHNFRFDHAFLTKEFDRLGKDFPEEPSLCTMSLAGGGTLEACCRGYGIPLGDNAHSALYDARATAQLLAAELAGDRDTIKGLDTLAPIVWPDISLTSASTVTRSDARSGRDDPPSYLQRLLHRPRRKSNRIMDDAVVAYMGLLDRVLEDRRVDENEGDALVEMASHWQLDIDSVTSIHRDYLRNLVSLAWADGVVTKAERSDLETVVHLLGIETDVLDSMLDAGETPGTSGAQPVLESLAGLSVCFTGELQARLNGKTLDRGAAEALANEHGLQATGSVTKKLDILVVADAYTQSGKAKKARKYGTRIMHEIVFWRTLGIEVE